MNNKLQPILKKFIQTLPPSDLVFAYGSAVQPQQGYDYSNIASFPMIDLMVSVDDVQSWHLSNLQFNKQHYSGLGYYLGSNFINRISNEIFPIHFSPFINYGGHRIKYGVVQTKTLIKDLENWNWLSLAGRMQKPILEIQAMNDDRRLRLAMRTNLQAAIAVSTLIEFQPVISEFDLLYKIMSLSYLGDIRFTLGGENQQKVSNLLKGNYESIRSLYSDVIKNDPYISKIIAYDGENIIIDTKQRNTLLEFLPQGLIQSFSGQGKNIQRSIKMMDNQTQNDSLSEMIRSKNAYSSQRMLLAHILTVSPYLNAKYALQKLKKRFN